MAGIHQHRQPTKSNRADLKRASSPTNASIQLRAITKHLSIRSTSQFPWRRILVASFAAIHPMIDCPSLQLAVSRLLTRSIGWLRISLALLDARSSRAERKLNNAGVPRVVERRMKLRIAIRRDGRVFLRGRWLRLWIFDEFHRVSRFAAASEKLQCRPRQSRFVDL